MINNRAEWDSWIQQQRNGCNQHQKAKLDESIELKIAVNQGDFQAAETIAIKIIGDNNLGVFEDFTE